MCQVTIIDEVGKGINAIDVVATRCIFSLAVIDGWTYSLVCETVVIVVWQHSQVASRYLEASALTDRNQ